MMLTALSLIALSSATFIGAGYLFGARRGAEARAALDRDRRALQAELDSRRSEPAAIRGELEGLLRPLLRNKDADVGALREEMKALVVSLGEREQDAEALRREMRGALAQLAKQSPDGEKLQRELQKAVLPLLRREDESRNLRDAMREVLAPMLEKDRMGWELANVEGGTTLGELPRMLDSIAAKGGFAAVVLSDEVGLPLASSTGAADVDALAAVASYFLSLADRSERLGVPRPTALVAQDASNQVVVHRIFSVDSTCFTLTAVSRGGAVAPHALDPALAKIEHALRRKSAA